MDLDGRANDLLGELVNFGIHLGALGATSRALGASPQRLGWRVCQSWARS
jgi:hypothetical protein